jgi:hypothetical protein
MRWLPIAGVKLGHDRALLDLFFEDRLDLG